ncbi:MAG TPA: TonB-dependent receptor, partial [Chryseosolibacter sp.]|nr:TonB-dependent receptor [Chryseosolibacter sp.]
FVTLSAYQTIVTDAIEYIYLWNGAKAIDDLDFSDDRGDTYINVGEQRARGVELEGFAQVIPTISIRGNVSMIETGIRIDPGNIDGKHTGGNHVQLYNLGRFLNGEIDQDDLFRRPDLTAFASLQYKPVEDFSVSASWRYTGKRLDARYDGSLGPYGALAHIDVEAYHLVDLGVGWQASEVINIGLKVENVLDEEYREVVGFQTKGRSLYLKVSARW